MAGFRDEDMDVRAIRVALGYQRGYGMTPRDMSPSVLSEAHGMPEFGQLHPAKVEAFQRGDLL